MSRGNGMVAEDILYGSFSRPEIAEIFSPPISKRFLPAEIDLEAVSSGDLIHGYTPVSHRAAEFCGTSDWLAQCEKPPEAWEETRDFLSSEQIELAKSTVMLGHLSRLSALDIVGQECLLEPEGGARGQVSVITRDADRNFLVVERSGINAHLLAAVEYLSDDGEGTWRWFSKDNSYDHLHDTLFYIGSEPSPPGPPLLGVVCV